MVEGKIKHTLRRLLGRQFSPSSFLYRAYHLSRSVLAASLNSFPGHKMIVIGVTGTNGKTTTCNLLANILDEAGFKVGLSTTINYWLGNKRWMKSDPVYAMTTETPFALQRLLGEMATAGCKFAIIETSSHALLQRRTWGVDFDVAILTNVTPEHLDIHGDFESYKKAKAELFAELSKNYRKKDSPKIMVLNLDDANFPFYNQFTADKKFFYSVNKLDGQENRESALTGEILESDHTGSTFEIHTPAEAAKVRLSLPGVFNVENALAAASAAYGLGVSLDAIKRGLEKVHSIPGRMEKIVAGQNFDVIVDYAHTPDGMDQVLATIRGFSSGSLICVFGAAGGREKIKRPRFGEAASKYADAIVLTEDDPGTEDPAAIIEDIRTGLADRFVLDKNLFIEPDRKTAIAKALSQAQPKDTVVILGMGAQNVIVKKGTVVPYNEREVVKSLLQSITTNPPQGDTQHG